MFDPCATGKLNSPNRHRSGKTNPLMRSPSRLCVPSPHARSPTKLSYLDPLHGVNVHNTDREKDRVVDRDKGMDRGLAIALGTSLLQVPSPFQSPVKSPRSVGGLMGLGGADGALSVDDDRLEASVDYADDDDNDNCVLM